MRHKRGTNRAEMAKKQMHSYYYFIRRALALRRVVIIQVEQPHARVPHSYFREYTIYKNKHKNRRLRNAFEIVHLQHYTLECVHEWQTNLKPIC